ncbi:MAG TPA: hypothetical protein VFQ39_09795, partial [Longimicrobium sp.]|nr:hypothetical protein [Longimicrobium sp.]
VADADIAITATVRARELRHAEAPRTETRITGTALADSLSCDTRSNLERPARAGRTYRDVRIDYRLRVRIDTAAAIGADTTGRP